MVYRANLVAAARIDSGDFVMELRDMSSETAASASRRSAAASAATLAKTSSIRDRIEEVFRLGQEGGRFAQLSEEVLKDGSHEVDRAYFRVMRIQTIAEEVATPLSHLAPSLV